MTGTIILISAIAIAISQYCEKREANKEKANANIKAKIAEEETKKYRLKFEKALETNLKLARENKALSEENNSLNIETLKSITGYDSFPILVIDGYLTRCQNPSNPEKIIEFYKLNFNLINSGKYPLTGIDIKFNDFDGSIIANEGITVTKDGILPLPDERFNKFNYDRVVSISSLPKNHTEREIYTTSIPKIKDGRYNVIITWNGGSIEYYIEVNPINGKEKEKFIEVKYGQIYSRSTEFDKKLISKKIKQEFPHLKFTLD